MKHDGISESLERGRVDLSERGGLAGADKGLSRSATP